MAKQANKNTEFPEAHSPHMRTMLECMSVCISCSKKCLEEGHKKTASLCSECADICTLAIRASNGHSEFKNEIMKLCSTVCKKCAEECKTMQAKHCLECAEVCEQCASACRA